MDQKLKQRLVGAIVLVSLAVFFIPIILEGPENDWVARNQAMPEPPAIDFSVHKQPPPFSKTPTMPAVVEKAAGQAKAEPPKAASTLPGTASRSPEKPTVKQTAKPVKVTTPPKSPETRFPPGSWGIQLGSFSDKANAAGLSDKLQAARYPSFLEDVKAKSGTLYKVIVGPYDSREAAEKIRDEISKQQGLKGFLTGLGS
jgi:DedD protein